MAFACYNPSRWLILEKNMRLLVVSCACWDRNMHLFNTFSHGSWYMNGGKHKTEWVTWELRNAEFQLGFQILPVSTLVSIWWHHHDFICALHALLVFWEKNFPASILCAVCFEKALIEMHLHYFIKNICTVCTASLLCMTLLMVLLCKSVDGHTKYDPYQGLGKSAIENWEMCKAICAKIQRIMR